MGRALEKRQSPSLTSGIHVRRDDLPDGWHWDKWHFLTVFFFYFILFFYINHVCVCWNVFLDIKHLVVNLFTMAFKNLFPVAGGKKIMDPRTASKIPLWRSPSTSAHFVFWSCHLYCVAPLHSKRQSHFGDRWLKPLRASLQTKLKAAKRRIPQHHLSFLALKKVTLKN